MAEFFSAKSQGLSASLVWLPQAGAAAGPDGTPPNSYAVLTDRGAIFVDAAFSWTVEGIRKVVDAGLHPLGFVFTHREVMEAGDAFGTLRTIGAPFFLHPADVPSGGMPGIGFLDPREADFLRHGAVNVIEMPGRTPGSIMLHLEREGGILLCGDAAVGSGPDAADEAARLRRPDVGASDEELKTAWAGLLDKTALATIAPYRGLPVAGRKDIGEIAASLAE